MIQFIKLLPFAMLAFLACGCSNYRLAGTPTKLPFSSVYVEPVRNNSYAPQSAALLTNAISNALMQCPSISISNKAEAQATLSTVIVDYEKTPIASNRNDTALAAAYRVTAEAECTLKRANGEIIFKNRKVKASTDIYLGDQNNLIGDEYQNMPIIMRELGDRVKDAVIGIW